MSVAILLEELRRRDIELRVNDGQLHCSAPAGALGPELREQLQQRKADILQFLNSAQALAARQPAIVPLQPHGERPAIFAVAGHNGDVFCYRALVRHLGEQQPFFGLQPPGLDNHAPPLTSVDALAAYFATQIRDFQPDGPCIIAGYCAGGTIAFELAGQLQREGRNICFVALFGSPHPGWYRFLPQLRVTFAEQARRLRQHFRTMLSMPCAELRQYLGNKLQERRARREATQQTGADPLLARRVRVEKATLAAVRRHTPQHFAGRVCLILPNRQWQHASDSRLGWPTALATRMDTFCGPDGCEGYGMLLAPNVSPFADFFRHYLESM